MSWESLNEIIDRSDEEAKARDIATAYFNCFNTEAGQYVLDSMIESFMTKPVVRSGEDAYAQGIRQGRQDVVMQIIQQIEYAKDPRQFEPKKSIAKWIKKAILRNV